jgi:hypothetical protein
LSDLCRGQRRGGGLLVGVFGSPGGNHCIWDLERLIEYGCGDDAVGSKVPDVVAQFAPRADERRLDVISDGKWPVLCSKRYHTKIATQLPECHLIGRSVR